MGWLKEMMDSECSQCKREFGDVTFSIKKSGQVYKLCNDCLRPYCPICRECGERIPRKQLNKEVCYMCTESAFIRKEIIKSYF